MTERYTNDAETTLAVAMLAGDLTLTVATVTGFPTAGNFRIRIDNEILLVTGVSGTAWTATRAAEPVRGVQTAAAHAVGATVTHLITAASLALVAAAEPAGSDTQVQFNSSSAFGASADLTFVSGTKSLYVGASLSGAIYASEVDVTIVRETNAAQGLYFASTKIGFFGATPSAQQAANLFLTDLTGGSLSTSINAVSGTGDDAHINDNFASVVARLNEIRALLLAYNLGSA